MILLGIAFGALGSLIMATSTSINMCIAGASLFGLSYGSGGNGEHSPLFLRLESSLKRRRVASQSSVCHQKYSPELTGAQLKS